MNHDLLLPMGALKARADEIRAATGLLPDSYMIPADVVEPHPSVLSVTAFGKPVTITDGEWGLFYEVKP
jgi:hypothetical protein